MKIVQSFFVTGRGMVAVVDEHTELPIRRTLIAEITRADGRAVTARCTKEYVLSRRPEVIEKEAYLLEGTTAGSVSEGDEIVVSVAPEEGKA